MLDIKFIRENKEAVKQNIVNRRLSVDIDKLLDLDEQRRVLTTKIEALRAEQNKASEDIAREKEPAVKEAKIKKMKELKEKLAEPGKLLVDIEKEYEVLILAVPNMTMPDVPIGKDENENKSIRENGKISKFDFQPKEHWQLGEELDVIDIARAAKVSGARFGYLKGQLAILEYALVQYAFSALTDKKILTKIIKDNKLKVESKPFIPIVPPVMIKPEVFKKMARLEPKEERYYIPSDDLYLIGSAEHTLGSMHLDEILLEKELPLRYVGFSTSFRREAGSYAKDMKGILRVHQFDKVEMESFSVSEKAVDEQNLFVAIQEYLMQSLKISYRVVAICTGDMGAPDARQIDIEAWLPGQNRYRETHTADYMADYQSRRLGIKVKRESGNEFVHMNDATVFAIGRTLIAIMENYQQKDSSILVPKVLQKYVGFKKIEKHD